MMQALVALMMLVCHVRVPLSNIVAIMKIVAKMSLMTVMLLLASPSTMHMMTTMMMMVMMIILMMMMMLRMNMTKMMLKVV